jgi:uncharacterized protein
MNRLLILPVLLLTLLVGRQVWADYQKGVDAALKSDYVAAIKEWKPLAEQGDATPQFQLGWLYEQGFGVIQNYETASKWYTRAAEQGYAFAQSALGRLHRDGKGVLQDSGRAYMWFSIAAESWDQDARKMRKELAESMSPSIISNAQKLARACVAKKYKGC